VCTKSGYMELTNLRDVQTLILKKTENMRARAGVMKGPVRTRTLVRSIMKKSGGFCKCFFIKTVVLIEV
jgi:hypothetical protein